MVEFAALDYSNAHPDFCSVGRWNPQLSDYVEIRGEVYPTLEEAQARALQLNEDNHNV